MKDRVVLVLAAIGVTILAVLAIITAFVIKAVPFALLVMVCAKLFYPQYPFSWAFTIIVPCSIWLGAFLISLVATIVGAATK